MKRILFLTICTFITILSRAEDVIVCKNSQRIDAIITEVSADEVRYKKVTNPNGPTFILKKEEIHTILYSDGDIYVNPTTNSQQPSLETRTETSSDTKERDKKSKIQFNPTPIGKKHIFGFTLGYTSKTISNNNGKWGWTNYIGNGSETYSPAMKIGFTITPEFKYGIGIQTGLYYEMCRDRDVSMELYTTSGYSYGILDCKEVFDHALVIPLRLQYRYEIIPDLSIFIYTGPEFELGLAYILNWTHYATSALDIEDNLNMYNPLTSKSTLNRFRMYYGVGAGIQWKNLQLRLGGEWGLTDIFKNGYGTKLDKPFNICVSYLL